MIVQANHICSFIGLLFGTCCCNQKDTNVHGLACVVFFVCEKWAVRLMHIAVHICMDPTKHFYTILLGHV
jgi:hypothetical protein